MLKGSESRVENWDDLRYLMAVHKTGSMSAAARLLSTNPATVSRRLARLAEALGYELFHKTPEGWVASDAIGPLLQSVSSFEGEIESYLNANVALGGQIGGAISIGMPGSLAFGVLYPRIAELTRDYPGIRLSLHAQTYRETLGENDLIISPIRPQQGRLIVKPIGKVHANVYCLPDSPRNAGWVGLHRDHDMYEPMQRAMDIMGGRPPSLRLGDRPAGADAAHRRRAEPGDDTLRPVQRGHGDRALSLLSRDPPPGPVAAGGDRLGRTGLRTGRRPLIPLPRRVCRLRCAPAFPD